MKYTITLHNKWNRPYFYVDNDDRKCVNVEHSSYETTDKELAKHIVKDFLDVPETEMTLEEIRKQFEDPRYCILTEEKLVSIQNYYNGRLGMYNTIIEVLSNLKDDVEFSERYDIPYEYNHFTVEDELENEEQIEAYIELKVEK